MDDKPQDPLAPMDVERQDQDLLPSVNELYERGKNIVWILKINGIRKKKKTCSYMTAFAVDRSGLLITCAQGLWTKLKDRSFEARCLGSKDFYKADEVETLFNSDVCIIKLRDVPWIEAAKLGSGNVLPFEQLLMVGNPGDHPGTGVLGRAAYQCIEQPKFSLDYKNLCRDYKRKAMDTTPTWRVMGHVYNKDALQDTPEYTSFHEQLLARLPIIQCAGLVAGSGSMGSPIFNQQGEVVGMIHGSDSGYEIGIHVSVLKMFLEKVKRSKA